MGTWQQGEETCLAFAGLGGGRYLGFAACAVRYWVCEVSVFYRADVRLNEAEDYNGVRPARGEGERLNRTELRDTICIWYRVTASPSCIYDASHGCEHQHTSTHDTAAPPTSNMSHARSQGTRSAKHFRGTVRTVNEDVRCTVHRTSPARCRQRLVRCQAFMLAIPKPFGCPQS